MEDSPALTEAARRLVGARLRRTRLQQGLSVRTAADQAGLSKTSVVAVEAGEAVRRSTYVKLAGALGLHMDALLQPEDASGLPFAVHRREDDAWYDLADFGRGVLPDEAKEAEGRRRLAESGVAPLNILHSRLEGGRIKPTIIEVVAPSETRTHPGEEHLFVLSGSASITIAGRTVELEEGESVTFWSSEPHRYAPKPGSSLPVRLLSVRVDA